MSDDAIFTEEDEEKIRHLLECFKNNWAISAPKRLFDEAVRRGQLDEEDA